MKVLVTRPLDDALESARQLAARGHEALIAPMLATQFHDGEALSLEGIQAVLATSANGVRALARRTGRRNVPLFAVGPQTAEAAVQAGFVQVRNADGDAQALAQASLTWARPDNGPLLHVHGGQGAGALAAGLRDKGFMVEEAVLYDVRAQDPPADVLAALRQGTVDAALFYSPRSARLFRNCFLKEALPTGAMIAICISPATKAALAPLSFREIRVAEAPNQASLLACLD